MVYARAYDATVEADYFAAMGRIESRLELAGQTAAEPTLVSEARRSQLLTLAEQLLAPQMTVKLCQEIGLQMCALLNGNEPHGTAWLPPPVPVLANAITS